MVWARSKMQIYDYLFDPRRDLIIAWSGKNPHKVYLEAYQLIKEVINVPESHILELVFNWEVKENAEKFKVKWRVIRDFDVYSFLRMDVSIAGQVKSGYGHATIVLKPRFITEYPQDTLWQQSILYEILRRLWHTLFYDKKRIQYIEESRMMVLEYYERLKKLIEKVSTE